MKHRLEFLVKVLFAKHMPKTGQWFRHSVGKRYLPVKAETNSILKADNFVSQSCRIVKNQAFSVASFVQQHFLTINQNEYPRLALAGMTDSAPKVNKSDSEIADSIFDWEGILMAVPKRKTTPSKKKMRSRHKQLKPRMDLVPCEKCNKKHPMHHLCPFCYDFNRWTSGKDGGVDRHRFRKN